MWNSLEGGTCWMKEGEVTRVDAVLSIENDVICGIMPFQRPEEGKIKYNFRRFFLIYR